MEFPLTHGDNEIATVYDMANHVDELGWLRQHLAAMDAAIDAYHAASPHGSVSVNRHSRKFAWRIKHWSKIHGVKRILDSHPDLPPRARWHAIRRALAETNRLPAITSGTRAQAKQTRIIGLGFRALMATEMPAPAHPPVPAAAFVTAVHRLKQVPSVQQHQHQSGEDSDSDVDFCGEWAPLRLFDTTAANEQ